MHQQPHQCTAAASGAPLPPPHWQDADIRTVMVTGDHARTAVSVAHKCGMLCQNHPVRGREAG